MPAAERVTCWARIKTSNKFDGDAIKIQPDLKTLNIHKKDTIVNLPSIGTSWSFNLDGVIHNTSQQNLYDSVVTPSVCHVLSGYNGCIMCYGQTGSGKTFTMTGLGEDFENRGITPRAIQHLFKHASSDSSRCYKFMVSYVQIYNETIHDLLSTCSNYNENSNNGNNNNNNENNNNSKNKIINKSNNNNINNSNNKTTSINNNTNHNDSNSSNNNNNNINKSNNKSSNSNSSNKTERLRVLEIKEVCGCGMVPGMKLVCVTNEDEALNLLFEGELNRAISAHKLNNHSSRSHCIFSIYVQSYSLVESNPGYRFSKLHLVDLAGSERIKKTKSEGKTRQEACYINKSLVFLEQVVMAVTRKSGGHIPYRQSKLTFFLKDSIGGSCKTLFIANVYGSSGHTEETVSTLRFTMAMMRVPVYPVVQSFVDPAGNMNELLRQVCSLKSQLSVQNALVGRVGETYEEPSEDEKEAIRKTAMLYLSGQLKDIEVTGLLQVKEILKCFKDYQGESRERLEEEYRQKYIVLDKSDPGVLQKAVQAGLIQNSQSISQAIEAITRATENFSANKKTIDPTRTTDLKEDIEKNEIKEGEEEEVEEEEEEKENDEEAVELVAFKKVTIMPSRNDEFEVFKVSNGSLLNHALFQNKELMKAEKHEYRLTAQEVNKVKEQLDECASRIKNIQAADFHEGVCYEPETGERVVTEEEFGQLGKLRVLKKQYKDQHEKLMELKVRVNKCHAFLHQSRSQLLHAFDFWFLQKYPQTDC